MVIDTNILVYVVDGLSEFNSACKRFLDERRSNPSPTFLTWGVCYEFLRVSTHPRVSQRPLSATEASEFIADLLTLPNCSVLSHTDRHLAALAQTLSEFPELRGNVMHDVHTAVLMREHGISQICTRDADFYRFPFLTVVDPLRQ